MIHVNHLSKRFGEFAAVQDLSLEVREGETLALLGPNGSGKSTTLKCMVGLTIPSAGEVLIGGLNVHARPREARRILSYLPQRVFFPEALTVREVLQFYGSVRRTDPGRVGSILTGTSFGFNGCSGKPVGVLSGGMLQRLGLAVACLPDVPVMIFDEPMINLDPEGAVRFRSFLLELKKAGKTIVFSSHILADVEQLADRVAILVAGRLVALESTADLRKTISRYSRMRLLASALTETHTAAAYRAGADSVSVEGEWITVTCAPDRRFEILLTLQCAGAEISDFSTEEPTLEDFYLNCLRKNVDKGE